MDRFRTYLFETHAEDEIRRWATSLEYFRFCRAYGGHANDGDQFLAAIGYSTEYDFLTVLGSLGLSSNELPADNPQPIPDKPYSCEEFFRFKDDVDDFPNLEQIGHCEIVGNKCFVWAEKQILTLSVVGSAENPYELSESDFLRAQRIDARLETLAARVIDPPQDNRNCICPKHFPMYWDNAA